MLDAKRTSPFLFFGMCLLQTLVGCAALSFICYDGIYLRERE